MPREIISTPEAPEYPTYSQAVKVGNTIYVAGTSGVDVTTGELARPITQEQTRQSLLNCQAILRAGGAELSDQSLCALRSQLHARHASAQIHTAARQRSWSQSVRRSKPAPDRLPGPQGSRSTCHRTT